MFYFIYKVQRYELFRHYRPFYQKLTMKPLGQTISALLYDALNLVCLIAHHAKFSLVIKGKHFGLKIYSLAFEGILFGFEIYSLAFKGILLY